MLTDDVKQMVKDMTGATDEEVAQLHSGHEKIFNSYFKSGKYQLVAEVVKSEKCGAQVKKGDKLIFDPFLNPKKSIGVMCPKALLPVLIQVAAVWEMGAEWAETEKENPPEIVFRNIRCMDPGLEDGGLGGVVYNIHWENLSD